MSALHNQYMLRAPSPAPECAHGTTDAGASLLGLSLAPRPWPVGEIKCRAMLLLPHKNPNTCSMIVGFGIFVRCAGRLGAPHQVLRTDMRRIRSI